METKISPERLQAEIDALRKHRGDELGCEPVGCPVPEGAGPPYLILAQNNRYAKGVMRELGWYVGDGKYMAPNGCRVRFLNHEGDICGTTGGTLFLHGSYYHSSFKDRLLSIAISMGWNIFYLPERPKSAHLDNAENSE